jgi:hypothetical protein
VVTAPIIFLQRIGGVTMDMDDQKIMGLLFKLSFEQTIWLKKILRGSKLSHEAKNRKIKSLKLPTDIKIAQKSGIKCPHPEKYKKQDNVVKCKICGEIVE